jgi:pimeloyl-ACP methyl ester carboxylesterase
MDALADEFRVISLDLPGHGELAGKRYSLDAACEVVAAACPTGVSGVPPVVVGLSMGGYTALEFGHRHPELTAGLVLCSCSAEGRGPLAFPYRAVSWLASRRSVGLLDWANLTSMRFTIRRPYLAPMLAAGSFAAAAPDVVREITTQDWTPKVAEYPGPILILNGALDLAFRKDERRWLAAARDGRLAVIPWAGHLSNMHRSGRFTEVVRGFVEDVTGGAVSVAF